MNGFVDLHGESITGVINTFDRVIFKGHLNGFFPDGAFGRYLSRRGILLKDAGRFFEAETQRIRDHVVSLAAAAGRPVEYLMGSSTHRSGTSKEAREIAERDGVTEGLVCVLWSPAARSHPTGRPGAWRCDRASACTIICTGSIPNSAGCTCACRRLTRSRSTSTSGWHGSKPASGIGAVTTRSPRSMTSGRSWRCASGSPTPTGSWSATQSWSIRCCPTSNAPASPATDRSVRVRDVLFTAALETIRDDLVTATALGASDVLHFLGRRPHPAFAGEVTIDSKKRLPGALPPQAVKFYDHANVFRVEINNPREVLRSPENGT